jgi:hypothetical protein
MSGHDMAPHARNPGSTWRKSMVTQGYPVVNTLRDRKIFCFALDAWRTWMSWTSSASTKFKAAGNRSCVHLSPLHVAKLRQTLQSRFCQNSCGYKAR